MPIVIYAPRKDGHHDGSIAKQTQNFIRKLFEDDTLRGLHIEPIVNSVDPKVRTGRVTQMYRAVLFKLQAAGGPPHHVFTGVWPHDEAIEIASKAILKTNPVNGLPELIMASEAPLPAMVAPTPAAVRVAPVLEATGTKLTLEQLTDELGIDPEIATRAMAATSEDELMALAESAVEWQGLALLDLAAGQTIDDVRCTLGLDQLPRVDDTADEEQKLLVGLETPTARMQFAWLRDDEELRRVIEAGDFAKWRTFLHPEQRRYAEASYSGSFRLTGGAGTGKTVVLLHRARTLWRLATRTDKTTITRMLRINWRTVGRIIARVCDDELDPARLDDLYEIGIECVAGRGRAVLGQSAVARGRVAGLVDGRVQAEVADRLAAGREAADVADEGDKRAGGEPVDPGNRHQSAHVLVAADAAGDQPLQMRELAGEESSWRRHTSTVSRSSSRNLSPASHAGPWPRTGRWPANAARACASTPR